MSNAWISSEKMSWPAVFKPQALSGKWSLTLQRKGLTLVYTGLFTIQGWRHSVPTFRFQTKSLWASLVWIRTSVTSLFGSATWLDSSEEKWRPNYGTMEVCLPSHNQNRKKHCFPRRYPQLMMEQLGEKCGNSTLQKKKNPAHGGGKEEEEGQWWNEGSNKSEQRAVHQWRATVLCQSLPAYQYNTVVYFDTFLALRLGFLRQSSSHVATACKVTPTLKPKGNTRKI